MRRCAALLEVHPHDVPGEPRTARNTVHTGNARRSQSVVVRTPSQRSRGAIRNCIGEAYTGGDPLCLERLGRPPLAKVNCAAEAIRFKMGGNMVRPRAADDFAAIRARMDELRREREERLQPSEEASRGSGEEVRHGTARMELDLRRLRRRL
jgi:hypothetical protein